ncbi:hypothetical protein D0Z03_001266 [Geotrichum reessii]|nr:hypothetical protein D0Z03_001266 [Galactomyces reessii]
MSFNSDSSEIYAIQKAFYAGDYNQVLSFEIESFSEGEARIAAQVLKYRAQIALGEIEAVTAELSGAQDEVEFKAIKHYIEYLSGSGGEGLAGILKLVQDGYQENHVVEYFGGITLIAEGKLDEALELLSFHQGSLEVISLIVQIRLIQNKLDLAVKELKAAKEWAQDNVVYNLSEAWVDFRVGGTSKYEDGYYIYEEISSSSGVTLKSLVGQLVAQLQLNRLPEASDTLSQALEIVNSSPGQASAELFINAIATVILTNSGDCSEYESKLREIAPEHSYLADVDEKERLFDEIAAQYGPSVVSN